MGFNEGTRHTEPSSWVIIIYSVTSCSSQKGPSANCSMGDLVTGSHIMCPNTQDRCDQGTLAAGDPNYWCRHLGLKWSRCLYLWRLFSRPWVTLVTLWESGSEMEKLYPTKSRGSNQPCKSLVHLSSQSLPKSLMHEILSAIHASQKPMVIIDSPIKMQQSLWNHYSKKISINFHSLTSVHLSLPAIWSWSPRTWKFFGCPDTLTTHTMKVQNIADHIHQAPHLHGHGYGAVLMTSPKCFGKLEVKCGNTQKKECSYLCS